jgi:hypothetical protein
MENKDKKPSTESIPDLLLPRCWFIAVCLLLTEVFLLFTTTFLAIDSSEL